MQININRNVNSYVKPLTQHDKKVCDDLYLSTNHKKYLIGRNDSSKHLIQINKFDAIVDDFYNTDHWNGLPVIKSTQIVQPAILVNCSSSISPVSVHQKYSQQGLSVIPYAVLTQYDSALDVAEFVLQMRQDWEENLSHWQSLSQLMSDEESCQTLSDVIAFRLSGDYRHMNAYSVRFNDQYFDPIVHFNSKEVFADCGGFDGDTTIEFIKRNPKYKKIFVFEPSTINYKKAQINLAPFENIVLSDKGVSDVSGVLYFNSNSGSASAVSQSGNSRIEVVNLDSYIQEPLTFIKMDLEGWEHKALQGASFQIMTNQPKLAIAVYHEPSDFWKIPLFVRSLRDDYKIYLRHYSEGWSETVMYFLPSK